MPASLLAQIGITPAQLANAPAELRLRVVDFLIRWESFAEASTCLALIDRSDAAGAIRTARVWQGLGYSDQAIQHLKTHLAGPHSQAVRRELCRLYLAANSPSTAFDYAKELTTGDAGVSPDWVLLADAFRRNNDSQAARQILLRQAKLAPRSRAPLLGLMRLYHDQHDDVVATAYAVQAMETAKAGLEPRRR
ncbi:MAG: hypothetical protein IPK16_03325 [Anaerolineales bacterium]|nr:hypothetical protein [Anaerolineales bacterium]